MAKRSKSKKPEVKGDAASHKTVWVTPDVHAKIVRLRAELTLVQDGHVSSGEAIEQAVNALLEKLAKAKGDLR